MLLYPKYPIVARTPGLVAFRPSVRATMGVFWIQGLMISEDWIEYISEFFAG